MRWHAAFIRQPWPTADYVPRLAALANRSAIPVRLELGVDGRLAEQVELAAYYAVSEALTNTTKHALASEVHVKVEISEGVLRIEVSDDGCGGATFAKGSGLLGLKDRLDAVGGQLCLRSPSGAGTTVTIAVPLDGSKPFAGVLSPTDAERIAREPSRRAVKAGDTERHRPQPSE